MNFKDYMYPSYLQTLLNDSRLEDMSCDIILIVEDTELKAHKSVLSAASPYFRAMFYSVAEFKESKADKIKIHDVDKSSVAAILEFIYTSKITINDDNVFQLMGTSNLFQIYSLKMWITNYLQTRITVSNCLGLYVKATFYDYYDLAEDTFHFILENFSQVINEDEFLEIPASVLVKILSSKFLNVVDESILMKCVMNWINVDVHERKDFAVDLMSNIELMNIPFQKLVALKHDPIFKSYIPSKMQEILSEQIIMWYKFNEESFQPVLKWESVRYGSQQGVILAIGGESDGMCSKNVECYTNGYDAWKCMIPQFIHSSRGPENMCVLPTMKCARCNAAVAYDFYNVYVLGGKGKTYLDDCETFSIKTLKWSNLKNIPQCLEGGSAVIFQGRLIFIGGRNEFGSTNEAWEWDKANKVWKSFPALKYPRSFHCTIALGGYIYTLGGFESDQETALKLGERYDPSLNKWFEIRGMQKARAKFGCAAVNNCIYVMGGIDGSCGIMSVEKYSVETNEWSFMSPMLIPRHSFSVTVCEKKIFCIGGSDSIHILHSVDKYNPLTNRWHFLLSMQMCRSGLGSATLLVPYITSRIKVPCQSSNFLVPEDKDE